MAGFGIRISGSDFSSGFRGFGVRILAALLFLLSALVPVWAETVVLYLKNGDRLAGTIVAEDTNRVVLTTSWIKELRVPVAAIERREQTSAEAAPPKSPSPAPPATNGVVALNLNAPMPVVSVPSPTATSQSRNIGKPRRSWALISCSGPQSRRPISAASS